MTATSLRIGSIAPNFHASTSQGDIEFHEWIQNQWAVLFCHPADYTPVCTTELGAVARLLPEFERRSTRVIGLSTNGLEDHQGWIQDINETQKCKVTFPLIADKNRNVATLYDMLDETNRDNAGLPLTVRSVFIIDHKKVIRLIMTYPASCGRNFDEILRVIDAMQLADRASIVTPANWKSPESVIVPPSVSTEKAKEKYQSLKVEKPYLRYVSYNEVAEK